MRKGRWSAPATRHGAMPTPATPRPASPPRCAARASRPATGSRSSAPTESSSSKSYSAAPGLARWRCRSTSPRGGRSFSTSCQTAARACWCSRTSMPTISRCWTRGRLAVEAIWLIGAKGNLGFGNAAVAPMPRGGERIAAAAVRPGDLGLILYTSGTTGPSKGVCCPHAQYFWWAVNTASLLQLRDGDVLCTSLPLFHTNALNTFYQALLDGRLRALREAVFRFRVFSVAGAKPRHRHLSARRHGADPAVAAGVPGRNRTSGQHCARARRAGAVSRRFHAAYRHPPA